MFRHSRFACWLLLALLTAVVATSCAPSVPPAAIPSLTPGALPTAISTVAPRAPTLTLTPAVPRPATAAPAKRQVSFTILHTNDSRGYIDPCG
jgi:2',3'-cyclic-nucleotide 2'-phosphodiesterase (5'-nucleotidase family)